MAVLRYGNNSCVRLDFADSVSVDELGAPRGRPLADPGAAVTAALAGPIEYPPLAQSTTPVDRVVLALDRGVPEVAQVTAAIVHALSDAGLDPDGITVLQSQAIRGADDPCRLVASTLRGRISLLTHDPDDRRGLAYLAVGRSGEAILINRALHEADVVLPVGCLRGDETVGYFGIHDAVYPTFSDAKTLQRFRGLGSLDDRGKRKRELADDVDQAAWLLGVNFTVQLVPAAGGQVLHVLAGQSDAVRRRGRQLYRAAWDWPVLRQASLVVAAIEGGAGQQTWDNVGRALHAAGRFVEDGGAIAVCCDLSARPGPAVRHLTRASSRQAALRHVGQQRPIDALAAAQLAYTLDRNRVYLLSRLDPSVVEDLDMVPIANPEELARLARRHHSCILLANAPYVTAIAEEGIGDEGLGIRD